MTTPLKTRVLLADDHAVVRKGLKMVLDAEPDIEVVAEAADGSEAVDRGLVEDIHLAILDVSMPRLTGIQAARELVRRRPEVRVLILSMHDNERYFFEALRAGASGYVLKAAADRDLVEACRAAMRGRAVPLPRGRHRAHPRLPRARARRRTAPGGPPDATRVGDRQADRGGAQQQGDRGSSRDQRQDRRAPSRQRPREAGAARPRRPDALRDSPRPRRAVTVSRHGGCACPGDPW